MNETDRKDTSSEKRGAGAGRAQVGTLTFHPLLRVGAETSISDAAQQLRRAKLSAALVGDGPRLVVTERDFVDALVEGTDTALAVTAIASRTPLWVTTTSTIAEAAALMQHHGVRHLIVIDPITGKELGVLSVGDILAALFPTDQVTR